MKLVKFLGALAAVLTLSINANAQEITMELAKPTMKGGRPLMEMINKRHSMREFSQKEIDKQTLSDILWAAWGINSNGKRTIPTARNQQNLKVYAFMADGVWFYDAQNNKLNLVTNTDLRQLLAQQDYVMDAPLSLVYVGSDENSSALHAGSSYQNVSLYAESKGLNAVVRGLINREDIKKQLNLAPDDKVIISITLGWKK